MNQNETPASPQDWVEFTAEQAGAVRRPSFAHDPGPIPPPCPACGKADAWLPRQVTSFGTVWQCRCGHHATRPEKPQPTPEEQARLWAAAQFLRL